MEALLHKLDDEMLGSVVVEQTVEHLEQRVDDRLTQGIGAFRDLSSDILRAARARSPP
jgi:hypothetical protein